MTQLEVIVIAACALIFVGLWFIGQELSAIHATLKDRLPESPEDQQDEYFAKMDELTGKNREAGELPKK